MEVTKYEGRVIRIWKEERSETAIMVVGGKAAMMAVGGNGEGGRWRKRLVLPFGS